MEGNEIIDALPYIDPKPGVVKQIEKMIEKEIKYILDKHNIKYEELQ